MTKSDAMDMFHTKLFKNTKRVLGISYFTQFNHHSQYKNNKFINSITEFIDSYYSEVKDN